MPVQCSGRSSDRRFGPRRFRARLTSSTPVIALSLTLCHFVKPRTKAETRGLEVVRFIEFGASMPMVQLLIILALSIGLIAALGGWRRDRRLLSESRKRSQDRDAEGASALEKANENLKALQADLQRRWQYLAEAQRLSHSGTFGWKVRSGELVWSDETYKILGFARETNPTLDLVFDRVHPEDRDRVRQLSDRASQNGMDSDVEHRILLPDGVIKYIHAVAHAARDSSGNLEYAGVVTDITE